MVCQSAAPSEVTTEEAHPEAEVTSVVVVATFQATSIIVEDKIWAVVVAMEVPWASKTKSEAYENLARLDTPNEKGGGRAFPPQLSSAETCDDLAS